MCVVVFTTAAKLVLEVPIVSIARVWLLLQNPLCASIGIATQSARGGGSDTSGSAVAHKVSFVEKFDKGMFAMAGY